MDAPPRDPGTPSPTPVSYPTMPGVERVGSDVTMPGAPPVPLTPGRVPGTLGHYRLLDAIGHGGMGTVFKAYHPGLDRFYALKVMHGTQGDEDRGRERFLLEARAAARIGKHPGIVQIHDAGCEQGWRYLAMELIDGRALSDVIGHSPLPNRAAAEYALAIAEAVQAAHDAGVIHRDLKPSNVLVTKEGRALVTDFGLARDLHEDVGLSREGQVLGTLAYMAPEQAEGVREAVGPTTDVYGIAATLYEMMTGWPPFSGSTPMEVWRLVLCADPAPPATLNPKAHRDLETICQKGLHKERSRRYATARAMAEDLRRYLAGEPILARPAGAVSRVWARVRRNRVVSGLAAALVLGGALLAAVAWRWRAQEAQAREENARRDRETERQRSEMTEAFLRELSRSGQALVSAARARRAIGDLAGMREISKGLAGLVAELKHLAPTLAEPWHYEGRMQRALSLFDEAERSQGEAIARARAAGAPSGSVAVLPPALYERGILRMQRFQQALEERRQALLRSLAAGRSGDAPPPVPSTAQVLAASPSLEETRALAEADLEACLRSTSGAVFPETDARANVARGAIVLLRGARDASSALEDAEIEFGRAIQVDRWLEEAYLFHAEGAMDRGEFLAAADRFAKGHDVDRGLLVFLLGEVRALEAAARQAESRGEDGRTIRGRALHRCEEALSLDVRSVEAWCLKSYLLRDCAEAALARGEPAKEFLQDELSAAEKASGAGADDPRAALAEGAACLMSGVFGAAKGTPPDATLERGLAALARAKTLRPDDAEAAECEAQTRACIGDWQRYGGHDPSEAYGQAIAAAEAALRLNPRSAAAASCIAVTRRSMGEWKRRHGGDPSEDFRAGIASCERALAVAPDQVTLIGNHAVLCRALAEWQRERGQDPSEAYARALAEYDRAWALNSHDSLIAFNRANLLMAIGEWRALHEQDPREAYEGAARGYEAALGVNPKYTQAAQALEQARAALLRARLAGEPWARDLLDGDQKVARREYDAAAEAYEKGILEAAGSALAADPVARGMLALARYNLACARAVQCAGQKNPREADRLRGLALDELGKAIDLGFSDASLMASDPDLAPLREDPRWKEIARRLLTDPPRGR